MDWMISVVRVLFDMNLSKYEGNIINSIMDVTAHAQYTISRLTLLKQVTPDAILLRRGDTAQTISNSSARVI